MKRPTRKTKTKRRKESGPEHTSRKLRTLKPHPKQAQWFAPLTDPELQSLASSMEKEGLQHPVHILPDGTILGGHNRVAAAKLLGWTTIDVIVRHDLLAQGSGAVDQFMITDNVIRRQMDPISLARAYKALRELTLRGHRSWSYDPANRKDLRDQLAAHFGKSGRHLDRYVRLLDLPLAVQSAVSRRDLPVSSAEELFRLTPEQRDEAAAAIIAGEAPKVVVRRLLPQKAPEDQTPVPEQEFDVSRHITDVLSFLADDFEEYIEFAKSRHLSEWRRRRLDRMAAIVQELRRHERQRFMSFAAPEAQ